jgi:micrococcal nuclease
MIKFTFSDLSQFDPEMLYVYRAQYLSNYDGDTITIMLDYGFNEFSKKKIRLLGVDTPEIRGEERPEGLIVKGIVQNKFESNPELLIKSYKDKSGKYGGRYLAEIFSADTRENLSKFLLDNGYAEFLMY